MYASVSIWRGDYGQDCIYGCASFTLIKDATYEGEYAVHDKDIIELHTGRW